jgi:hypothetical protein
MIKAALLFTRIHIFRYLRILNQLGIFRVLFLLIIAFYFLKSSSKPGLYQWQSLVFLMVVIQAHLGRKDHVLLGNLGLNRPGYFIALYLLLLSPVIVFYIICSQYYAALILTGGSMMIAFVRSPVRFRWVIPTPSFRFLPAEAWEWRAGLKMYFPVFLIAYILPAVFYRQNFLFGACVLLLAITANSFQLHHEPMHMMEALAKSPVDYLRKKIVQQCLYFTLSVIPLILVSVLLYPEEFRPILLIFVNSLIVQIFSVSLKYAGYMPGQQSQYLLSITSLMNFAFIFPAILPLPVIMAVIFTRKAISRLKLVTI